MYKKYIAIGALLASLTGCYSHPEESKKNSEALPPAPRSLEVIARKSIADPQMETITGIPLGVSTLYEGNGIYFCFIIQDSNNKKITYKKNDLANDSSRPLLYTEADALIQSEINDGDAEPIEVLGFRKKEFGKEYFEPAIIKIEDKMICLP